MTNSDSVSAGQQDTITENKDAAQFVGFSLSGQEYAFRIEQIQEIVILDQITRLPQVPDFVEGVSNLRGSIIPIINLRNLFGEEPKPADDETRTVVVNVGERIMGCTVDSVSQVMRIPAEDIQPAPDLVSNESKSYVSGFAKRNDQLVVLLDVERLLQPESLSLVHQAATQGHADPGSAAEDAPPA